MVPFDQPEAALVSVYLVDILPRTLLLICFPPGHVYEMDHRRSFGISNVVFALFSSPFLFIMT